MGKNLLCEIVGLVLFLFDIGRCCGFSGNMCVLGIMFIRFVCGIRKVCFLVKFIILVSMWWLCGSFMWYVLFIGSFRLMVFMIRLVMCVSLLYVIIGCVRCVCCVVCCRWVC